jgi:predicted signal transduction protein with EAL and GGDEF domain
MTPTRRRVALIAWIVLTTYVAWMLATEHKSTVPVALDTGLVAIGLLTIVSLLRGQDPWWTDTRRTVARLRALRRHR